MPALQESPAANRVSLGWLAGIHISLDYSWFIIFALVIWSLAAGYFPRSYPGQTTGAYWLAGLIATLFFFTSILVHELSHALMSRRAGLKVPEITLFIFGGMAHLAEEAKDPKTEFGIAIVGPLTSFVLAALFWGISQSLEASTPSLPSMMFTYLAWINLALGVFNLFPGFPLDGGRVFRAFWWWKTGSLQKATRVAANIGKGFAIALMIVGALQIFGGALVGGAWLIFIGMFLRGMAEGGYQEVMLHHYLEGLRAEDVMVQEVVSAPPQLSLSQLVAQYFLRYGYQGYPVRQDGDTNGNILGVVSVKDVQAVPEAERSSTTVQQAMTPLKTSLQITPDTSLAEALQRMIQEDSGRLLVMQDGQLSGLLTKTALLRFLELKQVLTGGGERTTVTS